MANISFSTIPQNIRVPLFYAEFSNVNTNQNQFSQFTCLIGQTVTTQPAQLVFVDSYAQAIALFGQNSMLADMVNHYRQVDPVGTVFCLPLPDAGSSVKASGTLTVTGTATQAGVLSLYIAGTLVSVGVASGDTATAIATSIAAAVNANAFLPVTASHALGVATLTAVHGGLVGNDIDVRLNYQGLASGEQTPSGISVVIAAMASGALNPDLTGIAAIIGDQPCDFIIAPYTDATSTGIYTAMMNATAGRWSFARQSYGAVFAAARATVSNLLTLGATLNDPHLSIMGYFDSPSAPWQVAAEYGAAFAVSSKADPARPTQTLSLPGVLAPPINSQMSFVSKQALLSGGIALFVVAPGNQVEILRSVTTYQKNQFGTPDQSMLDGETLFTLMAIIRALKAAITQKYPRSKLADDGTNFGQGAAVVTPNIIRAELVAVYAGLIDAGIVEDSKDFQTGLIVQRNTLDASRVDILFDPVLVSGLRVVAVLTQFALQAPAV